MLTLRCRCSFSVASRSGDVCNNCLYMAGTEMEHIRDLDEAHIEAHLPKLSLYYGRTDGWVPLAHYERMKERFPHADIHLCNPEIPHAFVLGYSDAVARLVAASFEKHLGLRKSASASAVLATADSA